MMMTSKGWSALMRRNLIYRRRNWMATLAEFALPILFCLLLVALKEAAQRSDHFQPREVEAKLPSDLQAIQIFSFTDYVTALQAKRICLSRGGNHHKNNETATSNSSEKKQLHHGLHTTTSSSSSASAASVNNSFEISGMPQHGRNWQVPFIQCDSRKCDYHGEDATKYCHYPKLGLAASNEKDTGGLQRALKFQSYIYERYPQLTNISLPAMKDNNNPFIRLFISNEALEAYVQHPEYGMDSHQRPKLAMAIVFKGNDTQNYDYIIRVNSTNINSPEWTPNTAGTLAWTTPNTNRLFASFAKKEFDACGKSVFGPPQGLLQYSCTGQYILNGLLTVQRFLHDWIMVDTGAKEAGLFVAEHGVKFVPFPSKAYFEDGFYTVLNDFLSLILTLSFLYPCACMISYIARERELGQKEFLICMSAKEVEVGTSWFCTFFLLHCVTATALARVSSPLFAHSDCAILWIFWQSSCLAFIVFSSCVPSLVSNQAKTASRTVLIGLLVFLAGYFLSHAISLEEGNSLWIRIICLHPVAAFGYGVQEIGRLEDAAIGATWHSWRTTDSISGFTVFTALQFLWLDCLVGTLLSWYFNRVIAGSEGGRTLPCNFPFRSSYWFTKNKGNKATDEESSLKFAAARIDEDVPVEPVSDLLRSQAESGSSIEIHNLTKVFSTKLGSTITAVDGLNLSLHQGQVTALLGHNGSGKSTTVQMLTGSIQPTDGFHVVTGKDSLTQMSEIRECLGICLQHNDCLFSKLTVRETLQFFSRLKGKIPSNEEIDHALQEVALQDKSSTLVMNLSGGMKRKLSVAIAFCGESKLVLLDEPTSGMDPYSRRFIWNVIKQKRSEGYIILLTTHFLDEAEILADKIAILANGRLQCVGSSLFLKNAFDCGYQLTIEKMNNSAVFSGEESLDSKLKDVVIGGVPEAEVHSSTGKELSFHLPLESASKFSSMLRSLEKEVERGSISSFGVSMTTLDEVFQKSVGPQHLARKIHSDTHRETPDMVDSIECQQPSSDSLSNPVCDNTLQLKQMAALLQKRKINFQRDKKAWLCTTIVPSIFVLVGFLSLKYGSPEMVLEPLTLDLKDYNPDIDLGATKNDINPLPFNEPGSQFKCQPGWCAYQVPMIQEKETNELYFYCGAQSYLFSLPNCSQAVSSKIMNRLLPDGLTPVGDVVRNINESSRSILDSADLHASSQYGAIYFTHEPNSTIAPGVLYSDKVSKQCQQRKDHYVLDKECPLYSGIGYVISYNFTALHAAPLYQMLADEAIVREAMDIDNFRMSPTIHPLPRTQTETRFTKEDDTLNLWFMVVLSFPFIAGHAASFIVDERQSKAKHLQRIAGVMPITYWITNLIWDALNYQLPFLFTVALMWAFDVDIFTTEDHDTFQGVLLLLFFFGPAASCFAYCASFFFTSGSLCNISIIVFGFLTGLAGPISSFTLRLIGSDPNNPWETLLHMAKIIEWFGLCFPTFCLGKGLYYTINIAVFEMRASKDLSVWDPVILLHEVIALPIQTVVYLLLAVCLDHLHTNPDIRAFCAYFKSFLTCNFRPSYEVCATEDTPEDCDVIAEEERINSGLPTDDAVVLRQVSKVYGTGKLALDNLSLGIGQGECFGLLGTNGAGKTTTLSILTSEFPASSGEVVLQSERNPLNSARHQMIGFCPQFDAIFENLTGREHVEFYASIKGMDSAETKRAAEKVLSQVGISQNDKDRLSSHYSGGTKRKLSMACALVGDPGIVFFDEVSTGIDPVSRREIWDTISQLTGRPNPRTNEKTCAILTTHSMEECEALCTRIGIMSRGRLLCLGSAQRLKSKFGQGYQLDLRITPVQETDIDFSAIADRLSFYGASRPDIEATLSEEIGFDTEQALNALASITGDQSLSHIMLPGTPESSIRALSNETNSPEHVISLTALASLAAQELRMQGMDRFICSTYPGAMQRERQDMKVRYEISSSNISLADIFATLEDNKVKLWLSEYGVNSTSLEQVFNLIAAKDDGELKRNHEHVIV